MSDYLCRHRTLSWKEHAMIDLYYWTTPNGHKITIFLEETGTPYKIHPVNIGKGEQFKPEFLAISPNNRIPALIDSDPPGGGKRLAMFESGAMLVYLAEKTGKFLPKEPHARSDVMQWLFWQMGGLGPMSGQNNHFAHYAVEKLPYAIDRYRNEVNRLYGVMNKRLADRLFLAGEYSIADMACYPWVVPHERQGQKIDDFPQLKRWLETIAARRREARLRTCTEDQSEPGWHPHGGRARDPVRPDRGVGEPSRSRRALMGRHPPDMKGPLLRAALAFVVLGSAVTVRRQRNRRFSSRSAPWCSRSGRCRVGSAHPPRRSRPCRRASSPSAPDFADRPARCPA
jgi:GST-like protein